MKYEHQINWTNACDTNLDDCTGRLVRNAWIVLLSTLTLHPPEWMANSKGCTSYDHKNRTNSYDFLRITRVNALLLSVSFKPIFVDFTLVIDMLLANSCHSIVLFMFRFFYSKKDSWGLHILFKKMATVKTLTVHSKKNQSRVTQANTDRSLSIITVVFVFD